MLQERAEDWHAAAQLDALAAITADSDNVEKACRFARKHQNWGWLLPALDSLMNFYEWHGRLQAARSFCQAINEQLKKLNAKGVEVSVESICVQSKCLMWLGKFTQNQEQALAYLRQSLELLEHTQLANVDVRVLEAPALFEQAEWLETYEQAEAEQCYQRSHALYVTLDDKWGQARTLEKLAVLAYCQSHFDLAIEQAEVALAIQEELGDIPAQSSCVNLLGLVHKAVGHMDEAERLHYLSLQLGQQIGFQSTICIKQAILADTLLWQGKFEEAKWFAEQALINARAVNHRLYESNAHCALGAAMLDTGDYQKAAHHANKGLEIVTAVGNWITIAYAHMLRGEVALVHNKPAQAVKEFDEGITYFQAYRSSQTGTLQVMRLYAECQLNPISQVHLHLEQVLTHTLKIRNYLTIVHLLPAAALFFLKIGNDQQAIKLWVAANCDSYMAKSYWLYDVIGRYVEEVAATLPADAVEAAKEEGKRQGVWQTAVNLQKELGSIQVE